MGGGFRTPHRPWISVKFIREPHGSHVVWDIPQVSQRVPADRIRPVPAGYLVWVPHGVPQGTRLGLVWVCWLGCWTFAGRLLDRVNTLWHCVSESGKCVQQVHVDSFVSYSRRICILLLLADTGDKTVTKNPTAPKREHGVQIITRCSYFCFF